MAVNVLRRAGRVEVYHDPDDWWVGYYRGDRHHYVGFLMVGVRWPRRGVA
jgi:hypothetical protein